MGEPKKKKIIIRRYCDEAMARKKGLFEKRNRSGIYCDNECKRCICCVEVDQNGDCSHVQFKKK